MTLRISVIGTGYLGATHAACMAELGHTVIGVDQDRHKINLLRDGLAPFSEPGLGDLLARNVAAGRLRFTDDIREAADQADVHFVCVGTPQSGDGAAADLGAVHAVVDALASAVRRDCLIVGKSTVPVGTASRLGARVADLVPGGVAAPVAWNPEFLREGHGIEDTLTPTRLVLGVTSAADELTLREVYRAVIALGTPVHVTDLETAELAKTAANAFLATKVSFINAMADLSDRSGADVVTLADILGDDPRIGRAFLNAGVGFGGGCLPKDLRALSATAHELGATTWPDSWLRSTPATSPLERGSWKPRSTCAEAVSAVDGSESWARPSSRSPTMCETRRPSTSRTSCTRGEPRSASTTRRPTSTRAPRGPSSATS